MDAELELCRPYAEMTTIEVLEKIIWYEPRMVAEAAQAQMQNT